MGLFKQKICSEHCEHCPALVNSVTSTMLCVKQRWSGLIQKRCENPFFLSLSVRNSNYESLTLYSHHLYRLQIAQGASIWSMLDET